jgi:isoamylase
VIRQVKLIAEPWDVGEGGYQVGNFPALWSEWNGKFRDTVRDYWRGADETLAEFAYRFTGSSDLYADDGRHPYASINFVTAHDGFTLADLVSYNEKHNEANGEGNHDGDSHNRSWNCGVEGPTDDPEVDRVRARQRRNFLATLFLSLGVPMLLGGDEIGRSQRGNNNAYCQDNELSWFDWEGADGTLLEFTRRVIRFYKEHPVLRRRRWFQGRSIHGTGVTDITWFKPDGGVMTPEDWDVGYAKSLGVILNGQEIPDPDARGERVIDDSFALLFNAHYEPLSFTLPAGPWTTSWEKVLDTDEPVPEGREQDGEISFAPGEVIRVQARALVVLRAIP